MLTAAIHVCILTLYVVFIQLDVYNLFKNYNCRGLYNFSTVGNVDVGKSEGL